jgi:membrane protein
MAARGGWFAGVKRVFNGFMEAQPFVLAAALSFYTLLSLAPLLIVAVAVAGFVFGEQAARGELVDQIRSFVGQSGAQVIQTILAQSSGQGQGLTATISSLVIALVGATTVFGQLQTALNQIWNVQVRSDHSTVRSFLRTRMAALGVVVLVGLLLLAVVGLSWALGVMQRYFPQSIPGGAWLWSGLDIGLSILVLSALAGILLKALPDVEVTWDDLWVGALITGVLLTLGKFGISMYLRLANVGSAYGVFGSLVVLLVWIYYSALILLFGAEVTQVYASRYGKRIQPAPYAERTDEAPPAPDRGEREDQDRRDAA